MMKRSCHRASLVVLYCQCFSAHDIHHRLGIHRSVIYRSIRRYEDLGTEGDRTGSGRHVFVTTTDNTRMLRQRISRNPARSVRRMSRVVEMEKRSGQ